VVLDQQGREVDLRRRHLPALDGLRAVAVAGVIVYHLGLGWVGGGYLGVDLFFVLSGFLITGLLVEERVGTGTVSLMRFWSRRARRLFPALLLVVAAVVIYAAAGGPNVNVAILRADVLATLFYVANWHLIAVHNPYFALTTTPSALEHTWSLAIEEQFYVAWPLLLLLCARVGGRRWRRVTIACTAVLIVASALSMTLHATGASDLTRAYFGTDTRVFELMVGALLALYMESPVRASRGQMRVLHVSGAAALCLLIVGFVELGGPPHWMFYGGFLGVAVLAAVVIGSVARTDSGPTGAFLSLRPMQWIGRISYGLYLWHWPFVVFLTGSSTGLPGWAVDSLRVALTVGAATLSFYLVEQPIRQRRFLAGGRRALGSAGATALAVLLVAAAIPTGASAAEFRGSFPGKGPHVAGAGGLQSQVPIAFPPSLVVDHAHPLRVLVFGDSVTEFTQLGIAAALESTGVVTVFREAFPGFGIAPSAPVVPPTSAQPWHGSQAFLQGLIKREHPQLLIGSWSWDSAFAKAFPDHYRTLFNTTVRQLLTPGNGVLGLVFLQMLPIGPIPPSMVPMLKQDPSTQGPPAAANGYVLWKQRSAGISTWNRIVSHTPTLVPGKVMYFPVAPSLELEGHYSTWLPPVRNPRAPYKLWERVRQSDVVHLCPAGVTRVGAAVFEDMREVFHLPPAAGKWWLSSFFGLGQDPSVCPHDHP
jgi:peptidoglycan/LPS O-acetylase OafA/YrhL